MEDIIFAMIGWMKTDTNDKIWGWCTNKTHAHPLNENRSPRSMAWSEGYIQFRINRNFSSWKQDAPAYTFWGKRDGSISFKTLPIGHDLEKLMQGKIEKGYNIIDKSQLVEISPKFDEIFNLAFVMHKLKQ
jgi:ribosomal protein L24E